MPSSGANLRHEQSNKARTIMTKSKIKKLMQDGFDDALKNQIKETFKTFVIDQESVQQETFPGAALTRIVDVYKKGLAAIDDMDKAGELKE
jgi:hypothetical protein